MKENEKYLDSIQGKIDQFNNSLQTFWMDTIDSTMIKGFVDFGKTIIDLVDKIGLLNAALIGVGGYFAIFKQITPIGLFKDVISQITNYSKAISQLNALSKSAFDTQSISAYAQAVSGLSAQKQALALAGAGLNRQQIEEVLVKNQVNESTIQQIMSEGSLAAAKNLTTAATVGEALAISSEQKAKLSEEAQNWLTANSSNQLTLELLHEAVQHGIITDEVAKEIAIKQGLSAVNKQAANTTASLWASFKAMPKLSKIGLILTVIGALIPLIQKLHKSTQELTQEANEAISTYNTANDTLKSQKQTVDELAASYQKLSSGVDTTTNKNIGLTTESYEEYLKVCNNIAEMFPNLIAGYDAEGNAILSLKGKVESLTTAYEDKQKAAAAQFLTPDNKKTIWEAYDKTVNKDTVWRPSGTLQEKKEMLEFLQKLTDKDLIELQAVSNGVDDLWNTDDHTSFYSLLKEKGYNGSYLDNGKFANFANKIGIDFDEIVKEINDGNGNVIKSTDAFRTNIATALSNVNTELDSATSNIKQTVFTQMLWNSDYQNADSDAKALANTLINNLDTDMIASMGATSIDDLVSKLMISVNKADSQLVEGIYNVQSDITNAISSGDDKAFKDAKAKFDELVPDDWYIDGEIKINDEDDVVTKYLKNLALKIENQSKNQEIKLQFKEEYETSSRTITNNNDLKNQQASKLFGEGQNYKNADEYVKAAREASDSSDMLAKSYQAIVNALSGEDQILQAEELVDVYDKWIAAGKKAPESSNWTDDQIAALQLLDALVNQYGTDIDTIKQGLISVGLIQSSINNTNIVKSYEAISESISNFNDVQKQTEKIVVDNTEVTQDYKDSLTELGISETEVAKCFDETNPLIVKDAKALNNLVKSSRSNITQNVKLAKSQAILKYKDLYKQIKSLTRGQKISNQATLNQVNALYQEMGALQKTIVRYSMLEQQLLGATNAYEKFIKAQETDSATDYISSAEDMVLALGKAFNTAELGSETARASIAGLVPESVYQDLDTVDEKMAAIYDYFKNGKLSQYFTLEFDDDGAITSAEMKLGNLRKFIEDGLTDNNVFSGSDWQHFEFSDTFLAELDNLPEKADKLQYFADKMGVTKEVAFAFIKSLEDHDIEWLNDDYSSMFESLLPENLENDIYKNTTALAELEVQLANGKITAEDYSKALYGLEWQLNSGAISQEEYDSAVANLNQQLSEGKITTQQYTEAIKGLNGAQNENAQKARENAVAWSEANTNVDAAKNRVETLTEALTKFKSSGAADQKIQIVTDELKKASNELSEALKKKYSLQEPTKVTLQLALDDIQAKMDQWKVDNAELTVNVSPKLKQDDNGKWTIPADVVATLDETEKEQIDKYLGLLNEQYTVNVLADENPNDSTAELENVKTAAEAAQKAIEDIPDPQIDTGAAISAINDLQTSINNIKGTSVDIYETTHKKTLYSFGIGGDQESNETGHVNGTAHASGNFGLLSSEHNALVGELGPEMVVDPHTGRYYTVGDNGAEMVDLPKGAIIFNHKQTKDLLSNGYVTSRGKMLANGSAHANGNAHVTIWPNGSSKQQWTGTGYSSWDDSTYDAADALNNAADNLSDATDDFEEVFDWVEVRLEEIDETLDLLNAKLENAVGYSAQNSIIDQMLGVNDTKMSNLQAGLQEYANYASKLLAQIPAQYQKAAQDGAIAIEKFAGKADEATLDAIKNYREWAQKVADLTQRIEELRTEIADLAKQKFDNVSNQYDNIISLIENANEKLDAQVSLMEDRGYVAAKQYYESMVVNTKQQSAELANEKKALQAVLDQQVKLNNIKVGSDAWYEMVNALYEVDAAIVECTSDLEKYQNAINDIYWDNFDQLINRLDYLNNETQGLINLMDNADMVSKPDNKNGWGAKDVEWTKEGIASLGLYAQQMEIAEYQAKQYAKAIDDLNKDYADGKYSENEYLDKLDELTSAQYDSIESYYDAQNAIKSLNETRIDAIKDGIEKEIDAYSELIDKKKEELNAEKDLYDFQKSTAEQQKSIADIQRKLSALSGDNSASAIAKKKKLEAELAQAKADLEESYYNRSVDDRSNALDKELEDFQDEKNAEIEKWESYLENIEQVVADSLGIVQANASGVYDTLNAKAQEYDLTLSDAIMTPWQNGALAISDYQTTFDTAMSSTWDQLENIKMKWQEIIDKMAEAAKAEVSRQQNENKSYTSATYTPPAPTPTTPSKPATTQKSITVGGRINAGSARIYAASNGTGGGKQYYSSNPIYTVLEERNGYLKVRHVSLRSGVTGWFKKSDVKAYAKGSKEIDKDQLGILDELGPELQLVPDGNGRLSYIKRGTAIIPSDISENLMKLGQLNPQDVLDRNRPAITPSKSIVNNEINIDCSVGTMVNIEHCDQNTLPDVEKIVDKTFNKHMQDINNSLKRFTR